MNIDKSHLFENVVSKIKMDIEIISSHDKIDSEALSQFEEIHNILSKEYSRIEYKMSNSIRFSECFGLFKNCRDIDLFISENLKGYFIECWEHDHIYNEFKDVWKNHSLKSKITYYDKDQVYLRAKEIYDILNHPSHKTHGNTTGRKLAIGNETRD